MMKYLLTLFFLFCVAALFALTPTEKLNLVGSADIIVTGKVLAETIAFPLRTDAPVKNISVKVREQYKGGVMPLFDITVNDDEPSLKIGNKYLFFLKYSSEASKIVPSQKTNWCYMESAEYLLLIDTVKKYPISVEIANPAVVLLYDKKNFIKCNIMKANDAKVEITNVKLNVILTSEVKNVDNPNPPALISADKIKITKIIDAATAFDIPVKLRNSANKEDFQVVVQPIFSLKIDGVLCEYNGAITLYYISNKEL